MEADKSTSKKRPRVDLDESFEYLSDASSDVSEDPTMIEDEDEPLVAPKPKKKKLSPKTDLPKISPSCASHSPSYHEFTNEELSSIRINLISWYDANQRLMPWRKPTEKFKELKAAELEEAMYFDAETAQFDQAYGALVSELMLQQTQVVTVIQYFQKWMAKFPTIQSLAEAEYEKVAEVWAGLGYYRRAKFIHECAKQIVNNYDGKIPETAEELIKLPGVGRYTAGAVASVVFGQLTPIVDGNVVRVLSRVRAIAADPKLPGTVKLHWKLADQITDPQRPGDFNQAIMDLGATICTPTNPTCEICPLKSDCLAYRELPSHFNNSSKSNPEKTIVDMEDLCKICTVSDSTTSVTKYPIKPPKKPKKELTTLVSIFIINGLESNPKKKYTLVSKRPDTGLLAGFWQFPSLDQESSEEAMEDQIEASIDELLTSKYGLEKGFLSGLTRKSCGTYDHKFTHIDQTLHIETLSGQLPSLPNLKESESSMKWTPFDSVVDDVNLAKSMKECLKLCNRPKKTSTSSESAMKGQRTITQMFAKKS